jgi:hypothetical protein
MSAAAGAAAALLNTQAFIDLKPTDLALRRPQHPSPQSWDTATDVLVPLQRVAVAELAGPNLQNNSPDAWAVTQVQIVAMPDADIQHNDYWVDAVGRWEVTSIHLPNGYELRAEATLRLAVE